MKSRTQTARAGQSACYVALFVDAGDMDTIPGFAFLAEWIVLAAAYAVENHRRALSGCVRGPGGEFAICGKAIARDRLDLRAVTVQAATIDEVIEHECDLQCMA